MYVYTRCLDVCSDTLLFRSVAGKLFPLGGLDLRLTHGSLGPPESPTQTASRSVQTFLHGSRTWLRPMSHLQFYRAILSRNFIAQQNRKCDMPCRALKFCRIDKNCPISVHYIVATELHRIERCSTRKKVVRLLRSCATRHVTLAILSRDKVARQNRAIKLQVWRRSNRQTTLFCL